MNNKIGKLVSLNFSILGIMCISSGLIMPNLVKYENTNVKKINVNQKKVSQIKTNEIILKDISIEVGNILSVNSVDYLKDPNTIDDLILKRLQLDISKVNLNSVGSYTYTITYNKKIYNGTINVIEKTLPNVDMMTLNDLSFEINSSLPTDISYYVKEQLSDEVKAGIKIDLSNVDITKVGKYLYSVSYNGKFYTSTITMYEPKINTNIKDTNQNDENTTNDIVNTN